MAREIEAASKEIKSIMKTVHSIRGMVQEGDINVGVLFGGPGAGGKPGKRTNSRRVRDAKDPPDSSESPPRPTVSLQPERDDLIHCKLGPFGTQRPACIRYKKKADFLSPTRARGS